MNTETIYGNHGRLEYEYFQPVYLSFVKSNNNIKVTKVEVPAIYFAGTVKKDNLEKSLDQIGLTLDVALTLSAIGNVIKLRHLTKLQQLGRITLASIEITSGFADIMVRYSDLCQGNENFCKAFQQYNTYLQLGLLSSGLIRAKFNSVRNNAKEEYVQHRETLVNKYGESDSKIKELDGHFEVIDMAGGLVSYPKVRKALEEVSVILKSKGIDRVQVERVLRQSDNLKYLEENSGLIVEISNEIRKGHFTDGDLLKIFRKAVNADFVRDLLPKSFVSALKRFGKTEDEIVSYFKNYHNIHTKGDFFEIIEEVLQKGNNYSLTRDETYAIWGYTTNFFYRDLNTWIREGINSSKTYELAKIMKDGLRKLPNYEGTAFRALELNGEILNTFLDLHKKGSKVTYKEFISAGSTKGAAFFDKGEKNVKLIMNVKRAPDISDYADGIRFRGYDPKELLLRRGSYFEVLEIKNIGDNKWEIYLNQLN